MKSNVTKVLILIVTIGLIFGSCRKFEEYPEIPEIEFVDFPLVINTSSGIIERGILTFNYKDGDGDLGLDTGDTLPPFDFSSPYYYNLIITYFEKQNGVFVKVPLLSWNSDSSYYDTLTFNSRFPVLTPESGNMNIKGVFQDTLYVYNPISEYDTIKFSFYIYDRALNQSNVVETGDIVRVRQ